MAEAGLSWPIGWPRTASPSWSNFETTYSKARSGMLRELRLLGATDVVITCNLPLRRDGLPKAIRRVIDDPGVAVYFRLQGEERCIPCDKWRTVAENLHAIELTVGALRGLQRWGAEEMVSAAFRGFEALPPGGDEGWWSVLEVRPDASRDEIEAAWRRLAKQYHPDTGGDAERFRLVAEAYKQALAVGGRR